nr:MAG TPA: YadA-like protein [Caudoviricetes sp.]
MNKTILTAAIFATVAGNAFAAGSIAVGQVEPNTLAPVANGYNSIVAGANSSANGSNVVVFGRDNTVSADDTTVIGGGNGTVAAGETTVIGYNNYVGAHKEQVMIGANSVVDNQGAIAIGTHTMTRGMDAVTIGNNASAPVQNSVAIGTNSQTYEPVGFGQMEINGVTHVFAGEAPNSSVSFGSKKSETYSHLDNYSRQLQNVAAGRIEADSLDAVNGSQLFAAIDEINSNGLAVNKNAQNIAGNTKAIANNSKNIAGNTAAITKNSNAITNLDAVVNNQGKVLANHEGRIVALESDNKALKNDVQDTQKQVNVNTKDIADLKGSNAVLEQNFNNKISNVMDEVAKTGAANAALSALHYVGYNADDKLSFAAGYGHYKNANAAALGAFYAPNEHVLFSVAGTFGAAKMVNAGVSFRLGKGSEYETNHKGKIAQLETLVNQLIKEVEELKAGK